MQEFDYEVICQVGFLYVVTVDDLVSKQVQYHPQWNLAEPAGPGSLKNGAELAGYWQ
jgi:hypothetical protein